MTKLKQLREICEAATPGKWLHSFFRSPIEWPDGTYMTIAAQGPNHKERQKGAIKQMNADCTFITTSRTAMPVLLDVIQGIVGKLKEDCCCNSEHPIEYKCTNCILINEINEMLEKIK